MQKVLLGFLAFAFVFAVAIPKSFRAQTPSPASHLPRGTATDISSAEVQALVQKTAADRVSDQAIRVVNVNGEYNVGIGVVHRAKTSGKDAPSGIEHAQITEVYHVIEGNGTLVTGGTLDNPREIQAESPVVTVLNGPSTGGTQTLRTGSAKSPPTRSSTLLCGSILTKYCPRATSPSRRNSHASHLRSVSGRSLLAFSD
ncbi:MAG: hypothetical protein DMG46_00590 [Acidobacteria bacterium]|nr:MAG: hypothetical protein DMG46_00590 [Acidobacteriota bacterium]